MSYVLICAVQVVLFKAKPAKRANIWLKYAFCMSKALPPYSILAILTTKLWMPQIELIDLNHRLTPRGSNISYVQQKVGLINVH